MRRYLSEEFLEHMKVDFRFLIDRILLSGFEYDIQLRDDYFNLYYKGKSLGAVSYHRTTDEYKYKYWIRIHHKYVDKEIIDRFKAPKIGNYLVFKLPEKQLHPLFSNRNLRVMCQKIKAIYFQEEVTFEQMIMTDNVNREDFIIIDRQIVEAGVRMDLLAVVKKEGAKYQFCVIEVKLGNNLEPRVNIIQQIKNYVDCIEKNFEEYKKCYEKNFRQKKELGLFDGNEAIKNLDINIIREVLHALVIVGYSGLAEKMKDELKKVDPSIKICQLKNIIDLSNC